MLKEFFQAEGKSYQMEMSVSKKRNEESTGTDKCVGKKYIKSFFSLSEHVLCGRHSASCFAHIICILTLTFGSENYSPSFTKKGI